MVRDIHQRRRAFLGLEPGHGLAQKVVGIAHRVVIGIDNLLARTVLQHVAAALRHEHLEVSGGAFVIGGSVAAHLVHHHHGAARTPHRVQLAKTVGQHAQHFFVKAFVIGAQLRVLQLTGFGVRHPITHTLAARLVVQPQHRQAGTLHHIEQILELRVGFPVALAPQV